jgi:Domain of unknown function (DUF1707)
MMESPEPDSRRLRASDADRERTAEALRRHHLDGRLDTDELQERLGRCYAARTTGDLTELLADLPGQAPPPPAPNRPGRRGGPSPVVLALVAVLVLAALGAALHGHPGPLPLLAVFLLLRLGRGPRGPRTAWGRHG